MLDSSTRSEIQRCLDNRKERFRISKRRKQLMSAVSILVLLGFFTIASICMVMLPRPKVSEIEKRELAKLPTLTHESYTSGEFFRGISEYYSDTVPFREQFIL